MATADSDHRLRPPRREEGADAQGRDAARGAAARQPLRADFDGFRLHGAIRSKRSGDSLGAVLAGAWSGGVAQIAFSLGRWGLPRVLLHPLRTSEIFRYPQRPEAAKSSQCSAWERRSPGEGKGKDLAQAPVDTARVRGPMA